MMKTTGWETENIEALKKRAEKSSDIPSFRLKSL
jgi:hypothetical protein